MQTLQEIGLSSGEVGILVCLLVFMLGVAASLGQQYKEQDVGKRFRFGLAVAVIPALIVTAAAAALATN